MMSRSDSKAVEEFLVHGVKYLLLEAAARLLEPVLDEVVFYLPSHDLRT